MAAGCGLCRRFAPVFDEASERHPDVVFAKVDTEAEQNLASALSEGWRRILASRPLS